MPKTAPPSGAAHRAEPRASEDASRKFEFMANTSRDYMSLVNRNYEYEAVNSAYAAHHGRRQEDIVGRNMAEVWGPETFEEVIRPCIDRCLAGEEVLYEAQFSFSDKEPGCYEVTYYPYKDAGGTVTHVVVVSHDVTERKRAELAIMAARDELEERVEQRTAELREVNARLEAKMVAHMKAEAAQRELVREKQAIFGSIPDGLLTVDRSMRLLEANRPMKALCGLAETGLAPRSAMDSLERQGCPCYEVLRRTLRTKKRVEGHRARCKAAGADKSLELTGVPLLDDRERFTGAVLVVRDITRLEDLERRLSDRRVFGGMVGSSAVMQRTYALIEQLAHIDSTVLVTGESGTGKELVAEALHHGGARADGPLVKVNCSALSEHLLESELFGHVRGAFSGAVRDKAGRFQRAQGGTILLDEIGDVSPLIQLKLLRVLENKEFERVGDAKTMRADVRIVAATNADLLEKVRDGLFREDLYFRLKVMRIDLPPLRERTEDIPQLCAHFIDRFNAVLGKHIEGVDEAALAVLMRHPWPGNIRELKHAVEHACVLCPGSAIEPAHLPPELSGQAPCPQPAPASDAALTSGDIVRALEQAGYKKARAARSLGISRSTLYRMLDRHGIDPRDPSA